MAHLFLGAHVLSKYVQNTTKMGKIQIWAVFVLFQVKEIFCSDYKELVIQNDSNFTIKHASIVTLKCQNACDVKYNSEYVHGNNLLLITDKK